MHTATTTYKEAFSQHRLGRFLSPDPYGQFYSAYTGMGNNPVNLVDPSGGTAINYTFTSETIEVNDWYEILNWGQDWESPFVYGPTGGGGNGGSTGPGSGSGGGSGVSNPNGRLSGPPPGPDEEEEHVVVPRGEPNEYNVSYALTLLGNERLTEIISDTNHLTYAQVGYIESNGKVYFLETYDGAQEITGIAPSPGFAKKAKVLKKIRRVKKWIAKGSRVKRAKGIIAPKGWITKTSKKEGGIVFKDPNNPHNAIRQMPGKPNSPNVAQQKPYVKFMKEGKFYDGNGKVLPNGKVPEAHIPLDEFNINIMPKF